MDKEKVLIATNGTDQELQLAEYLNEIGFEVHMLITNYGDEEFDMSATKEAYKPFSKKIYTLNCKSLSKTASTFAKHVMIVNDYAYENGFENIAFSSPRGSGELQVLKKLRKVIKTTFHNGDAPQILTPFKNYEEVK